MPETRSAPSVILPPADCTATPGGRLLDPPPASSRFRHRQTTETQSAGDSAGRPGQPSQTTIDKHEWQATYDVIVYGLDAGGAVAAITAAEGREVLVIDPNKNTDTGGYTRCCKQNLLYTKTSAGPNNISPRCAQVRSRIRVHQVLAQGGQRTFTMADRHMARPCTTSTRRSRIRQGERHEDPAPVRQVELRPSFYTLLLENLKAIEQKAGPYKKIKGSINYSYSTHLIELIQDPETKTILGVEVESTGKKYKVRATNGVILASGGFQNNEDMVENFLQMPEVQAKFKNTENGDGIIAAQKSAPRCGTWVTPHHELH